MLDAAQSNLLLRSAEQRSDTHVVASRLLLQSLMREPAPTLPPPQNRMPSADPSALTLPSQAAPTVDAQPRWLGEGFERSLRRRLCAAL